MICSDIYERLLFTATLFCVELAVFSRAPRRDRYPLHLCLGLGLFIAVSFLPFEWFWGEWTKWTVVFKHLTLYALSLGILAFLYEGDFWSFLYGSILAYCVQHAAGHADLLYTTLCSLVDKTHWSMYVIALSMYQS